MGEIELRQECRHRAQNECSRAAVYRDLARYSAQRWKVKQASSDKIGFVLQIHTRAEGGASSQTLVSHSRCFLSRTPEPSPLPSRKMTPPDSRARRILLSV